VSLSHSACGPSSPDACAAGNESPADADISSLLGMLASVTDPRSPQGIQHTLEFVLAVYVAMPAALRRNGRRQLPMPVTLCNIRWLRACCSGFLRDG
jgi:hypothetical protein